MPEAPVARTELLNGRQIYFETHGTGEPLLLISGFSGTSQDWNPSLHQWNGNFQWQVSPLDK